ncbi:hypothetical protein LCGC14_2177520 [marine sediment metagenome]|uniref:Uncharacterized protein n=1 Tax=marine sediment metagenome TaxID=412755 RepID=A0A0F9GJ23_9ZZZZ
MSNKPGPYDGKKPFRWRKELMKARDERREHIQDVSEWILSPEGRRAIRQAAERCRREEDRLRRASIVSTGKLMEPLIPWRRG